MPSIRLYRERISAGLCGRCGVEPDSGFKTCSACRTKYANEVRVTRSNNLPASRERERRYRLKLRQDVFDAYGTCCTCCGETHISYLELDHINGGGIAHRASITNGYGGTFYKALRRDGYPDKDKIQVLCANCHRAKTRGETCPPHRPI